MFLSEKRSGAGVVLMNSSHEEDQTDKREEKESEKRERHLHNMLRRGNEMEAALPFFPDCLVQTTVKTRERPVIAAIDVTDRCQIALYGVPLVTSPRSAFVDLCD